jgi:hypothetical protein
MGHVTNVRVSQARVHRRLEYLKVMSGEPVVNCSRPISFSCLQIPANHQLSCYNNKLSHSMYSEQNDTIVFLKSLYFFSF